MENEIDNFGAYLEDCIKENKQTEAEKIIKYIRSYLDENVGSSILSKYFLNISCNPIIKITMTENSVILNNKWRNTNFFQNMN